MNACHRIEIFIGKHLNTTRSDSGIPDFSMIRAKINENAMNNPVVSKKFKEEIEKQKSANSLPSHEVVRSLNPASRKNLDSNQLSKSTTSKIYSSRVSTMPSKLSISDEMFESYPDLQILKAALDSLFTSTFMHNDKILIDFLKGLGKLTINMLEENGATKAIIPTRKKETAIFGVIKILEVTLINMSRIDIIWGTVIMNELAILSS